MPCGGCFIGLRFGLVPSRFLNSVLCMLGMFDYSVFCVFSANLVEVVVLFVIVTGMVDITTMDKTA